MTEYRQKLIGKRALVTGASRGIGSAVALRLAREGADVVLLYCGNRGAAEENAKLIRAEGREATLLQANLSDREQVKDVIARAGKVDILVLNASVQIRAAAADVTDEDFDRQMNANFYASLRLITQAVPGMKERGWGRIITIGSVQEVHPHPMMPVYSASKAAQTNLVRSLAPQLAPFGITVNNVSPGVVLTDRNREVLQNPVYAEATLKSIPVGRFGRKEDLDGIVSLLASDEASFITGQSIGVDGGNSVV